MNYIICDDIPEFAEKLKTEILAVEPDKEIIICTSIREFTHLDDRVFLDNECVFMDIEFKGEEDTNGILAFLELKEKFSHLRVVYVTGYCIEYSQNIFLCENKANPTALIVKPVQEKFLHNALEKIHSSKSEQPDFITVKSESRIYFLKYDDISFIESEKRKVIIHTVNETIETYGKLSELEKDLSEDFLHIHKSFMINRKFIRKIDHWNYVELSDGRTCPVSRSYRNEFKEKLIRVTAKQE